MLLQVFLVLLIAAFRGWEHPGASRRRTGLKAAGLFTPLFLFGADFVGVLASGWECL